MQGSLWKVTVIEPAGGRRRRTRAKISAFPGSALRIERDHVIEESQLAAGNMGRIGVRSAEFETGAETGEGVSVSERVDVGRSEFSFRRDPFGRKINGRGSWRRVLGRIPDDALAVRQFLVSEEARLSIAD